MDFEILLTERLQLRKLNPEVFRFVYSRYSDNDLKTFFGYRTDVQLETEKEKYAKGVSTFNKSFLYFQLIDQVTNRIAGWCGFHTWYLDHHRAEIGYVLTDDSFKGKGFMTEAIEPVLDYGFTVMNLHRIEAFVGPGNLPSLKLMEKFNFTQEGHVREHYLKDGNYEDSLIFSLLKTEY